MQNCSADPAEQFSCFHSISPAKLLSHDPLQMLKVVLRNHALAADAASVLLGFHTPAKLIKNRRCHDLLIALREQVAKNVIHAEIHGA